MKKINPINKIIALVLSFVAIIPLVIYLVLNPELEGENAHTVAALVIATDALFEFAIGLFSKSYKDAAKRLGTVMPGVMLALAIAFMIVSIDVRVVTTCFAFADIVLGVFSLIVYIPEIKEDKLAIADVVISLGRVVFGTMLIFEGAEGLGTHIVFDCAAFLIEGVLRIVEFVKEKKEEKED